ncbi:MAG: aldehyde dehydrogenase family protein, partial [Alphaproteobacteria bacterium]
MATTEATDVSLTYAPKGLYIGGQWVEPADGKYLASINPANGRAICDVPYASAKDVERAVEAARRGFALWSEVPLKERAAAVEALAARILAHADELALIDSCDSGNTLDGMVGDMKATAESLRYFAGLAREVKGETLTTDPHHLNYTLRQPFGVVAKINAFNHPFRFCAEKVAAPLVAGNSVVVKQPEQAPISGLRFGELCDGLFPDGTVNVITGDGATGSALVRHPQVMRIAFIGSVETGRIIAREAAEGLKRVSLELGGKNPVIVFPDADAATAVSLILKGMNLNRQGQSCSSTSRVFLHRKLHDEVVGRLAAAVAKMRVGLPWLKGIEVGPIVSKEQHARVASYIEHGKAAGAALVIGGDRPAAAELKDGFFINPAVFTGVTSEMRLAKEEIFGPVMSVLAWDDYERMIAEANGVIYGLTAAIVTNDMRLAMETATRLEAGY